jgi:hypothetical protein
MAVVSGRFFALLLAVGYVVAAWLSSREWGFTSTVALGSFAALALIWFPEEIESSFRMTRQGGLTGLEARPSPGWLVATMGWVFLVGIPLGWLVYAVWK